MRRVTEGKAPSSVREKARTERKGMRRERKGNGKGETEATERKKGRMLSRCPDARDGARGPILLCAIDEAEWSTFGRLGQRVHGVRFVVGIRDLLYLSYICKPKTLPAPVFPGPVVSRLATSWAN